MAKFRWFRRRAGTPPPYTLRDVDDELQFHLERRIRDYEKEGLDPDAARAAALERLGDLDALRAECAAIRSSARKRHERRERITISWLDFKLGFRMLARYPGLTVVGGLSMAFAIALGAAAFEAVSQIVRPSLPFPEGDRIVAIRNYDIAANQVAAQSVRDYRTWRAGLQSVRDVGAYRTLQHNLITGGGEGAPVTVAELSSSAFRVTAVPPVLGRVLDESDERNGAASVAVLGYDVWQARFGGDTAVIGRTVLLGGSPVTIVGVMPEGFVFPMAHDVWTPLREAMLNHDYGEGPPIGVFGRLAPGATIEQARAELEVLGRRATEESPRTHEHIRPQLSRYAELNLPIVCGSSWTECLRLLHGALYSANLFFIGFVILVCANVALMMFARAAARQSEMLVRSALGASRRRIISQLVAEALVLGGVAAIVGLAGARLALEVTLALLDRLGSFPFWWQARLSPASMLYAVGLTVLGAIVAGVVPGLKVTRAVGEKLRGTSAGAGGLQFGGLWTGVIVAQVALTVIVVAMGGYIIRMTSRISSFELGFPAHQYLAVRLAADDSIPAASLDELGRRLSQEPLVRNVTFASALPGAYHGRRTILVEGVDAQQRVQTADVPPGFFDALGASITAGRAFRVADVESDARVLVVNEAFVEHVLHGQNAVGRRVRFQVSEDPDDPWGPWHEIVGVTSQLAMGLDPEMSQAGMYSPLRPGMTSLHMAVHVRERPESFVSRMRSVATAVDPALRLYAPRRLDALRADEAGFYEIWARILAGASLLVLTLSLAGIYAITAFAVSQRTREIGVRRALGAPRRAIILSVLKRPLIQAGSGVLIGVGLLLIPAEGVGAIGIATVTFTTVMIAVCMLACVVPVRRALRVEPTEALRAEM